MERLENEQSSFRYFIYITTHFPILPSLYLHHSSFSNTSVASPTSQFILQPFHCFTYITAHSPTLLLLHLHHSSFSNPSFASPTSQALHLIHLASRPCPKGLFPSGFPTKTLSYAFLDCSIRATCPSHLSRLDLRRLIMLGDTRKQD